MDGNGVTVKPGQVVKVSDCKSCQCIDNSYVCDESDCKQETEEPFIWDSKTVPTTKKIVTDATVAYTDYKTTEVPFIIIPTTVTPPIKCDKNDLVGMMLGDQPLPDKAFTATSILGSSFKPHYSRLNSKPTSESSGSWSPEVNDKKQYLQIEFPKVVPLYGVAMRGSPIFDQYVTSFKILHSFDGSVFHYVRDEKNIDQTFAGPIDSRTPVETLFKIPVEAKVIRILPITWHEAIAIRVELLGCSKEKPKTTFAPVITTTTTMKPITTTVKPARPTKPIVMYEKTTPYIEEEIKPMCDDPLGLESGIMTPSQIKVSSTKASPSKSKPVKPSDLLKLSSPKGWTPMINSPNEFVLVSIYFY